MYPAHVNGVLVRSSVKAVVNGRFDTYMLDEKFYQLKCNCLSDEFTIMTSEYPEAKCICQKCGKDICVYDVSNYPSSNGYDKERGNFQIWQGSDEINSKSYKVFLYYEYSEDAEDENEISWFALIAQNPKNYLLQEVINDETN